MFESKIFCISVHRSATSYAGLYATTSSFPRRMKVQFGRLTLVRVRHEIIPILNRAVLDLCRLEIEWRRT